MNAYGKCFVSSTGHRKLDRETLFKSQGELLTQHERIMALRHKFVAHSAENEIDSVEVVVTETDTDIHLAMSYQLSFPYDRLYQLRALIKHVTDFFVDEQSRQLERVSQSAGKPVTVGARAACEAEQGGANHVGT